MLGRREVAPSFPEQGPTLCVVVIVVVLLAVLGTKQS